MATSSYPVEEGLFTWPVSAEAQLIGSRCGACAATFFPSWAEFHEPDCPGGPVEEILLSRHGTLVSYTVQRFPAPPPYRGPSEEGPYGMGTVAFPEGIQIPGQLTEDWDLDELRVGLEAEVVISPLYLDDDGHEAMTWKFRPSVVDGRGEPSE